MRPPLPKKQRRALRMIASSLLASEFTPVEIHHIAEALSSDPNFRHELAFFLHELASIVERRNGGPGSFDGVEISADDNLVSVGLAVVKRRRLSKDQIMRRIRSISPGAEYFQSRNQTVREILSTFAENEPEEKMRALIEALGGPGETDEYLKAMLR